MTDRSYCAHCRNDGLVTLDDMDAPNMSAPCPMCDPGRAVEASWFGRFWSQRRLADLRWNGGWSSQHRRRCRFAAEGKRFPCGIPTVGTYCDYHGVEANRMGGFVPPDAGSLPRPKVGTMDV